MQESGIPIGQLDERYLKLDTSNDPLTGDLDITKSTPEIRQTDTISNRKTRVYKQNSSNISERKNEIITSAVYSLGFNGSNTSVDCGVDPQMDITGAISMEAWLNLTSTGAYHQPFYKGNNDGSDFSYSVQINPDGTISPILRNSTGTEIWTTASPHITFTGWQHVVVQWDGTQGNPDNVQVWVDNVLVESFTKTGDLKSVTDHLWLGSLGAPSFFNDLSGKIDEARIYNRVLTPTEIANHYNSGLGQYGVAESGLVMGHHFDEGTGSILNDYSSYADTCTATGHTFELGLVQVPNPVTQEISVWKSSDTGNEYGDDLKKTTLFGDTIETARKFVSTLITGTKPLDVTSTTLCDNLNADLLDGQHASEFEPADPAIQAHLFDYDNPHLTTAAQVGAVALIGDTMTGDLNISGTLDGELISNGGFTTDTVWTKGTGWTISGGQAVHTAGAVSNLSQSISVVSGNFYQVQMDIVATSGSVGIVFPGQTGVFYNSPQTVKKIIKAVSTGTLTFSIQSGSTVSTHTIDNVSVKQITNGNLTVGNTLNVNGRIRMPYSSNQEGVGGIGFYRNIDDASAVAMLSYGDNTGFNMGGAALSAGNYNGSAYVSSTRNNIQTTSTDGMMSSNNTASTAGVPVQMSPRIRQSGTVWDTGSSSSKTSEWIREALPTSGNPTSSILRWGYSLAGSAYSYLMSLSSAGVLSTLGLLVNGTTKLGDGGSTNYVEFQTDGTMVMHGTARVWEQNKIDALSAAKGVSAPTNSLRAIGASGGVLKPVIQFSKTVQEDIYFEFHAPYAMDESDPCHFHLVWLPGAGWTSGNYVWKLEYLVKSENDSITTGTPTTIVQDITPTSATTMIETEFPDSISFTAPDQVLICHFYRDVASDNADDVGEVNMLEIHYKKNKQGENI